MVVKHHHVCFSSQTINMLKTITESIEQENAYGFDVDTRRSKKVCGSSNSLKTLSVSLEYNNGWINMKSLEHKEYALLPAK
jgi:hypothetical protein